MSRALSNGGTDTHFRRVTRDSAVYAFGSLMGQISSLVTFPLYTRVLTVEAYGVFALLMALISVGRSVLVFGMNTAMIRFYVGGSDEDRGRVVGTAMTFTALIAAVSLLVGLAWPEFILSLITDSHDVAPLVITATMAVLASDVVVEMLLALSRARQTPRVYVGANVTRVLVTLAAVSVMLFTGAGVIGAFAGVFVGNVAAAGVLLVSLRAVVRIVPHYKVMSDMLRFGAGLVPANLASWALNVADRYVIERFLGLAAVGLYSAGYRVGSLVSVALVLPFHTAFLPLMFEAVKDGCGDEFIARTARHYTAVVGFAVMGVSGVGSELLRMLAGDRYAAAGIVIGPVALGCALAGSISVFGPGILIRGKTHVSAAIFILAALANVVGNIFVVPRWGLAGAAAMTAVTYFLLSLGYVAVSQRIFPVTLDLRRMLVGLAVVTTAVTVGVVAYGLPLGYTGELIIRAGAATVGALALIAMKVVTVSELRDVAGQLSLAVGRRIGRA